MTVLMTQVVGFSTVLFPLVALVPINFLWWKLTDWLWPLAP